jgi:putative hydrolase of the HAD superfamily
MRIEAVVFDWGGVLAGGGAGGGQMSDVEQRLGVPSGSLRGLLGMHPYETDTDNVWHMRELGRATALDWAHWYSARITAAGGVPLLAPEAMVAAEAARFTLPRNEVVIDAVRRLHAAGYKLAICTNNFVEIGDVWRDGLPLDLFDAVVVSCEIGVRKPDPEMFDHVTDRLGVEPGATLLVDDIAANVDGARKAGWHAILVEADHTEAMSALAAILAEHAT